MATYLDTYNLAHDESFRKRIQTAALIVARDIINDGSEDQWDPRHTLAKQAVRLDEPVVDTFAWEAALDPKIAAAEVSTPGASSDSDLGFVVSTVWNRVAGQPS